MGFDISDKTPFFKGKLIFKCSQKFFYTSNDNIQGISKVPLAYLFTSVKKLDSYDTYFKKYLRKIKKCNQKKGSSATTLDGLSRQI